MRSLFSRIFLCPELALSVIVFTGCPRQSSLPGTFEIPRREPAWEPASRRLVLVADNQIHNLYGRPVYIYRNAVTDELVTSAIRPVQLDFYGQDLLGWVVDNRGAEASIVHLGDAADASCTDEFEQFVDIMGRSASGWAMAPGNHDGFFYGNESPSPHRPDWEAACANGGTPMTKDMYVRLYLAALYLQDSRYGVLDAARTAAFDPAPLVARRDLSALARTVASAGEWPGTVAGDATAPLVRRLAWQVDEDAPWRSFVVQEIDVTHPNQTSPAATRVSAILLDTSEYERRPTLVPIPPLFVNAGLSGSVLDDQAAIVRRWMEASPGRVWIVLGHHPYNSLVSAAQKHLDSFRRDTRLPLYVSAHTHSGEFITHRGAAGTWLELNVGSVLDWSVEYRTLNVYEEVGTNRLGIRSRRYTMRDELAEEGVPKEEERWEAKPGDEDHYVTYEQLRWMGAARAEAKLKNILLASHRRLLVNNPTSPPTPDGAFWPRGCRRPCTSDRGVIDEIGDTIAAPGLSRKVRLLRELRRFENERPVEDQAERSKFRLSQAIWASKYDSVRARKPLVDDSFILFPKELRDADR